MNHSSLGSRLVTLAHGRLYAVPLYEAELCSTRRAANKPNRHTYSTKSAFISHGVRCIYPHKFACQWSAKQPGTLRSQQQPLVSRGSISYIRSTTVDFDLHVSGAAGHCHVNTICASHSTAYKVHMPNVSQMSLIDAFLRMLGIEPFRRVRRSNHTKVPLSPCMRNWCSPGPPPWTSTSQVQTA